MISRRLLLAIVVTSAIGLSGCYDIDLESTECRGDCGTVEGISAETEDDRTVFDEPQTTVSVKLSEPYTGRVGIAFYDSNGEYQGGDEKRVNGVSIVRFEMAEYHGGENLVVEVDSEPSESGGEGS